MRPRKYFPSERIYAPNSIPSAQISTPDVAVVKFSKTSEAGGIRAVGTGATGRRRNYRGKPGDLLPIGTGLKEALPVSKRYQAKHDELIVSKEKLLSKNQQLTALNDKLRRSLDRQSRIANDLQKVLCSTDVATILLDVDLNIRFFTPAAKLIFNVIPADIGRPLTDLSFLAPDVMLLSDARKALHALEPIERDIKAQSGAWYVRRISPCRAEGKGIEGVVITYAEITQQKAAADALECARMQADIANASKSRFLAAASHDLRQPLQTLVLLQGLLATTVVDEKAKNLIGRLDQTLEGMSGMLSALLDINRIEAGTVRAELETFRIDAVIERVTAELAYQAEAQRITLDVVPCRLSVHSDPRLLEQMIRNLLSNALKYTKRGRVLVGCRRRGGNLSVQIWDTGIGIPEDQFQDIFEEYHQLGNSARDRSLGLGLGLSIVKRLGILLDHPVTVHSAPGKGSVFAIEVKQCLGETPFPAEDQMLGAKNRDSAGAVYAGMIAHLVPAAGLSGNQLACPADIAAANGAIVFVVDDDSNVRLAIRSMLEDDGHLVEDYEDGESFLDAYRPGRNACLLIDADLPGISGLELLKRLKDAGHRVPAIMITGHSDVPMAVEAMKAGASDFLEKPVRGAELLAGIRRALDSSCDSGKLMKCRKDAADHLAGLTQRQHQIMEMVLAGHPSKIIAADLRISQRTVENHRASIMKKAGVRSLPALARLALAAAGVLAADQSLATMSEVLSS